MTRTRTLAAAGALLAVGTLAGCGQDGTITLPSQLPSSLPSVSVPSSLPSVEVPTAMPSVSVPSISVPTPTRTRTPAETTAPTKTSEPAPSQSGTDEAGASMEPSKTPTETPTQTQTPTTKPTTPTATPTETVTVTATPTPSATPTSASPSASPTSASPSASASAAPSASVTPEPTSSSGTPWWPWLLLGLVVLAGLIWFFARRSRGNSWDDRLAVERTQAQWVLAELLTVVTDPAGTPSAQSVQWSSAQPTLDQLDKGLADLIATAPDEDRRGTATALSKSLADVRNAVGTDLALRSGTSPIPADPASLGTSAAAVQSTRDRFAAALANATPAPDGNGSSTPPPAA